MARERVVLKSEEKMDRARAADFLEDLAAKVRTGELVLRQDDRDVRLELPRELVLEVKVEEEEKGTGVKNSLEIELEWYQGGGGRPSGGVELA